MARIGELNRRITIERATVTQDSFGEPDTTWSTYATVWARVEPMTGREMVRSDLDMTTQPHLFRIRYSTDVNDVTTEDRVTFNSKTFDLESVVNIRDGDAWIEMVGVHRG